MVTPQLALDEKPVGSAHNAAKNGAVHRAKMQALLATRPPRRRRGGCRCNPQRVWRPSEGPLSVPATEFGDGQSGSSVTAGQGIT